MKHMQVRVRIDAPVESVFEYVSDHERFLSSDQGTCTLTREGSPERNGLGAVREVRTGGLTFSEEIVQFDAPRRFDYVVTSLVNKNGKPLPLKHERGWMAFEADGSSTVIEWHSRFRVTIPIVGWLIEPLIARKMTPLFLATLMRAKGVMEAGEAVPKA